MRWGLTALLVLVVLPAYLAYLSFGSRPEGLQFSLTSFDDLPEWGTGPKSGSLQALQTTCAQINRIPPTRRMPGAAIGGRYGDWLPACTALTAATPETLISVVEEHFLPLAVWAGDSNVGTFTGYYEALLKGSYTPSERYNIPLYSRPPELVQVDLGQFRPHLKGQRVAGTVKDGRLVPYPSRKHIMDGALMGRDLEVLWVDSRVDAYFLHVQGSGRVMLPDGTLIGIGYAAQNGHANRLVGRELIEIGAVAKEDMSGQAIRAWFKENPDKIDEVVGTDPSFVFFRPLEGGAGPYGSANVALTAGYSLAVDRKHLPLHAPVWLSASYPDPVNRDANIPMNRLMVAQDTGGAISGEIRGDVFWGFGPDAEEIAGRMANAGRYWLLLPRDLALKAAEQAG